MSAESLISTMGLACNVETRTESVDAGGSLTWTWPIKYAGIKAFVQPASGAEALRYGRESNRKFHIAYVRASYDIKPLDRLTGLDLGTRILDIEAVRRPGEFGPEHRLGHLVLDCQETD